MTIRGSLLFILLITTLFGSDISFKVSSNKSKVMIGEKFKVTYTFSFNKDKNIAEVNFSPPVFENLHIVKKDENSTKTSQSWIYTLLATKDKNITIESAYLDVAFAKDTNKSLGEFDDLDYDYKSFETKPLKITIIKSNLNSNIKLFGNFEIKASIDKNITEENQPVNLTVMINGDGNFEDIGAFDLKIKDTTVYKDSPIVDKKSFVQKFSIISNRDFVIPPFEIVYTDKSSRQKVVKKTYPINIKVKNTPHKPKVKSKKTDIKLTLFIFLAGLFLGSLTRFIKTKKKNTDKDFEQKIKDAKDTKEILHILLTKDKTKYKPLIDELEKDIYITKDFKLSKKEIRKKIFTSYLP